MPLGICQSCGAKEHVKYLMFCENVSYLFERKEKIFKGYICSSCMKNIFAIYTQTTLSGTWFGAIGMLIGPIYIFLNIVHLIVGHLGFWFEARNLRSK